jgi:parallel beta-helix repeat protein
MSNGISQITIGSIFLLGGVNLGVFTVSAQTRTLLRNQPATPKVNVNTSLIYVNPVSGNDQTGKGTIQAPFRSITNALLQAKPTNTIKLASGTYTVANGEIFPIQLKSGVIISGNETNQGRDTVILGGGNFLSPTLTSQNITVLGMDQAELRGVTVTNKNLRGYGLWLEGTSPKIMFNTFTGSTQDGVLVLGKSAALISKNIFTTNGANGMSIEGMAQPEVNSNRFENTGYGIIVRQSAAPRLISNILSNNRSGIIIQQAASPILRGNVIERNKQTGITILGNCTPDLGSVSSSGNNIIRNNLVRDVQYTGTGAIAAVGNQILRISGNIQLSGQVTRTANTAPLNFPNNSLNIPPNSNIRTVIPNSVVVRSTLPVETTQPLPPNTKIDSSLPPVMLTPPSGAAVNRTITITRAKPAPSAALRYRVVISANSESSKSEVRRLVPNAFTSRANGQEVLQVGAYSDRTAADEQVKKLAQIGLNAEIQPIAPQPITPQ